MRKNPNEKCTICNEMPIRYGGRCGRCASYFCRHGTERPLDTKPKIPYRYGVITDKCLICGEARKIHANGRCGRCSDYFYKHKIERPLDTKRPRYGIVTDKCLTCEDAEVYCAGLCQRCYRIKRRSERGLRVIPERRKGYWLGTIRKRRGNPRWCSNCCSPNLFGRVGRCENCHVYFKKNRKERPRHLWDKDSTCKTCNRPLVRHAHPAKGYCGACYGYIRKNGRPRPCDLWDRGEYGWCECGRPASHQADGFSLCDSCAADAVTALMPD